MGFARANGLDQFYSILKANQDVHIYVDVNGNPTTEYPHVHVIHHASHNTVDVVASLNRETHVWKKTLAKPSGNEVETAIAEARQKLIRRTNFTDSQTGGNMGYMLWTQEGDQYRCLKIVAHGTEVMSLTRTVGGVSETVFVGQTFSLKPGTAQHSIS